MVKQANAALQPRLARSTAYLFTICIHRQRRCAPAIRRGARRPPATKLHWRTTIVDLLKLLDIDSSFTARKELATERGCPAELIERRRQSARRHHADTFRR